MVQHELILKKCLKLQQKHISYIDSSY